MLFFVSDLSAPNNKLCKLELLNFSANFPTIGISQLTKVAAAYFSGSGTTSTTAASVIEGVVAAGAEILDARIIGEDIIEDQRQSDQLATRLDERDAIIFGTPTFIGSVSGQLKTFFDAMAPRWFTQKWRNKVAVGFTASSLAAGDKAGAFTAISAFVMQMDMIWVGTGAGFQENMNTNGFYLGLAQLLQPRSS